ncbi:MAG: ATP-binding protein [Spirochaetota bacterium]|nr:ATP-binding protein [Spirochaetota bacterium]
MLSSKFVKRVMERIEKLDEKSLKDFIYALSQDREFFETIFESMIEGIIVLDDNSNVQYINKPALSILHIHDLNVIEKNFFAVITDEQTKSIFQKILDANQKLMGEECTLRYPVTKTLQISLYPLVKEGKILGNVMVFLDITSHKEEQLKLHRAESLAALTTLAAGVAHEIKNPLGSLDIHVQLLDRLVDNCDYQNKHEFKDLLQVVTEEIDRLNSIVTDFLFTVRPIRIKPEDTDIIALFDSILKLMKHEIEIKGISLSLLGDESIKTARVDGRYLTHAFLNILKNSLEACERGDEITITIERDEENLVIEIKDSGRGISQDNLGKVFEPYFTTKDFGTGLGLTIVYKIIREHHGNIRLDSAEGEGTSFTITIPCYHQEKRLLNYDN